jgi:hypothetical protein
MDKSDLRVSLIRGAGPNARRDCKREMESMP